AKDLVIIIKNSSDNNDVLAQKRLKCHANIVVLCTLTTPCRHSYKYYASLSLKTTYIHGQLNFNIFELGRFSITNGVAPRDNVGCCNNSTQCAISKL
ncbi:MAG: hypothetical protein PHU27_08185, partial [Salinivirgaceae bacterium]|nr:hypothetical protein [Salinivirgaceae bacterium]